MRDQDWGVATDALVVEQLLATTLDPVTHRATAVSLHSECPRMRAEDAVLSVVTLAYDTRTTRALPGRARGLDVAERLLCRHLEQWATTPGSVVAIGEAAVAYLAMTDHEEAQQIRESIPALRALIEATGATLPLVGAAQGPSRHSSEVVARAIERLVLPRGHIPAQDQWTAGTARRAPLWDATTGRAFGSQLRLQAQVHDDDEALRAECVQALTRPPRFADTATALLDAVPHLAATGDDPVVWDATSVLAGAGPSRERLTQLLVERCPTGAWIGVVAWLLNLPEVVDALRTLRSRGHLVAVTGYGSGREPLRALDELPADAVLLDPYLERGALVTPEDRVVLDVVLDDARRAGLPVLTSTRAALARTRRAVPLPGTRTPAPRDQILERARLVGMTMRETAVLLNATHGQGAMAPRWDRYDVASHWARAAL